MIFSCLHIEIEENVGGLLKGGGGGGKGYVGLPSQIIGGPAPPPPPPCPFLFLRLCNNENDNLPESAVILLKPFM